MKIHVIPEHVTDVYGCKKVRYYDTITNTYITEEEANAKEEPDEEDIWGRVLELEGALLIIKEKLLEMRGGGLSDRSKNDILKYIEATLQGKKQTEPEVVEEVIPYEDSVF